MDTPQPSRLAPELVERYRQELMQMHRQKTPPPTPSNWLDEQYPLPDIQQDRAALAAQIAPVPPPQPETTPQVEPEIPPEAPPIAESPFVGYLRVFVFTANGAEPLEGARVTVSREGETDTILYANVQTDMDGYTPVIPLPSVDPALSLRPDGPQPFVPYDITVSVEGFRSARHENVPIYGNNYVTQPVSLVPLLPGRSEDTTQQFQSGGPADL